MKQYILLLAVLFAANFNPLISCDLSGNFNPCNGVSLTQVYTLDENVFPSGCGGVQVNLDIPGALISSVIDANGNQIYNGSPSSSWSLADVQLPIEIRVTFEPGNCYTFLAELVCSNGINACSTKANINTGASYKITDITAIDDIVPCTRVTFEANVTGTSNLGCAINFVWYVNGVLVNENPGPPLGKTIEYYVGPDDCPLTVEVRVQFACGGGPMPFTKDFQCEEPEYIPISYSSFICVGKYWNVNLPGPVVGFTVLNSAGNSFYHNGNSVWFYAANPGTVVFEVEYQICGQTVKKVFIISVFRCFWWSIGDDDPNLEPNPDDAIKYRSDDSVLEPIDLKIYPNPVKDELIVDLNSKDYHVIIFNMAGQFMSKQEHLSGKSIINVSDLPIGQYLIRINSSGELLTEKFLKID